METGYANIKSTYRDHNEWLNNEYYKCQRSDVWMFVAESRKTGETDLDEILYDGNLYPGLPYMIPFLEKLGWNCVAQLVFDKFLFQPIYNFRKKNRLRSEFLRARCSIQINSKSAVNLRSNNLPRAPCSVLGNSLKTNIFRYTWEFTGYFI